MYLAVKFIFQETLEGDIMSLCTPEMSSLADSVFLSPFLVAGVMYVLIDQLVPLQLTSKLYHTACNRALE